MILPWRRGIGPHIRAADRAMLRADWAAAAASYAKIVAKQPGNAPMWIQYGHALKEMGDIVAAERAYASAVQSAQDSNDALFHHARALLALGRTDEAMQIFVDILNREPDHRDAYAAMVHAGGRDRLPDGFQRAAHAENLGRIASVARRLGTQIVDWVDSSTYPLTAYDAFRHDFAIRPPPPHSQAPQIWVVVDARRTAPSFLRSTLLSLIDQAYTHWQAVVVAAAEICDHPVGSLAAADPRIRFVPADADPAGAEDFVLHITAGTVLDPQALAWFGFTALRTGCAAAWCDEDRGVDHWRAHRAYSDPLLWGVFDVDLIAQTRSPPAAILLCRYRGNLVDAGIDASEQRRRLLLDAARSGPVAHVPRILATVLRIPERAEIAPAGDEPIRRWSADPFGAPPMPGPIPYLSGMRIQERPDRPAITVPAMGSTAAPIQVIIPTRDAVDLLAKAIDTILSRATRPERLEILIVDNRSTDPETQAYLTLLEDEGRAKILRLDEPFNWSRANNLAAAASSADHIVFANNDIEMLTSGWDDLMVGLLDRPGIGVVGARLLYPDGSLQHAGMIFGTGEGSPRHEGVHALADDAGPLDRYDLNHAVAAVTGAFMGIRRVLFDQAGQFDAIDLAVGYNDVDLCLKVRAAGLTILYTPAIELIHHESKTRGFNVGRARVAWDQGELSSVYRRWGEALLQDPAYNPHWSRDRLYDGYRDPTMSQILSHIDLSARDRPWMVHSENAS
jgi:GT2 family glycosyltransferase/tetratricopeptide (TPR) repeat protein